jgi:uncharacterized protein
VIVDVHTHTPSHVATIPDGERVVNDVWRPDRSVAATTTWQDHGLAASEAGIGVSIAFNIAVRSPLEATGLPTDPARVNDTTADFVRADPGRRIGFMSVHPDDPGALEEIERGEGDLGLRGIKLGASYQDFDPLGPAAVRVYQRAVERRLPILFHAGAAPIRAAPLRYGHPLTFDEIAIRFPELRIVIAHLGHPWQADTFTVIRKHPNVFADVSAGFYRPWSFYSAMRLATEWGVLGKLLFGSDFPVATPAEGIAGLRAVAAVGTGLPPVPAAELEAILARDTLGLLGIDRPSSPVHGA